MRTFQTVLFIIIFLLHFIENLHPSATTLKLLAQYCTGPPPCLSWCSIQFSSIRFIKLPTDNIIAMGL